MCRRLLVVLVLASLVLAPLAGVAAQESSAVRDSAAIVALEVEMSRLLERGDFDAYARHLAPDYARTTNDGVLQTRDEALAAWRARGPAGSMIPTEMWVRVYGDAAILTALVVGQEGGPGVRITKTFVRINGTWLLAALAGVRVAGAR